VLAIGVVKDHVHLLLRLAPVLDVPRLVQGLKGASARVANRDCVIKDVTLRWAAGYDLRSVSPCNLVRAERYVKAQAKRHRWLAIGK
jgi:REP element-mobilizing transposase RayT